MCRQPKNQHETISAKSWNGKSVRLLIRLCRISRPLHTFSWLQLRRTHMLTGGWKRVSRRGSRCGFFFVRGVQRLSRFPTNVSCRMANDSAEAPMTAWCWCWKSSSVQSEKEKVFGFVLSQLNGWKCKNRANRFTSLTHSCSVKYLIVGVFTPEQRFTDPSVAA